MSATYDLSTNVGKVRLLIPDTDTSNAIFSDEELEAFLDFESSNPQLAAARAFGAIIRDKGRLAKVIAVAGYRTEQHAIADLSALADKMREEALGAGGLQTGTLSEADEHLESYRPSWRDSGEEVVE